MANLIIEMPDGLARRLEGMAAAQHKTVPELAVERLSSLVGMSAEAPAGSASAVLRAMMEPPHPSAFGYRRARSGDRGGPGACSDARSLFGMMRTWSFSSTRTPSVL
jgi:hypothetical protein